MKNCYPKQILLALIFSLFYVSVMAGKVKTGLEVLISQDFAPIKGKRVGLITNPMGVDHNLQSTVDLFFAPRNSN